MTRIVIADDHAIFREGLRNLLAMEDDFEVIGEAGTGRDALSLCRDLAPNTLLLDIDLPEMDGMEVMRRIKEESIPVKVVVLTMHTNEEYAVRMIKMGASGYIPKYVSGKILPEAIRAVMDGKTFIPEEMREIVFKRLIDSQESEIDRLTDRELQVFKALAAGKSINEIADGLGISPRTVETHKSRIMEKMNLKNIAELVRTAIRLGVG